MVRAAQQGGDPFQAIFASGRILLAGLLFIFPGVDLMDWRFYYLIWPRPHMPPTPESDVIEGEYRREDGVRLPKD